MVSGWFVLSVGCVAAAGAMLPRPASLARISLRAAALRSPPQRRGRVMPADLPGWWTRRLAARRLAEELLELAESLAAELRAGAAPRRALWRVARDLAELQPLAGAAAAPSGDVLAALQALASRPGGARAGDLATAWAVCEAAGGSLAEPATRLAAGWRDEEQVRREVLAQLAGPRATAVLLSALPLVGLALAASLGADPRLLVGSGVAVLALLVPGLVLELLGVVWIVRITRRAGVR